MERIYGLPHHQGPCPPLFRDSHSRTTPLIQGNLSRTNWLKLPEVKTGLGHILILKPGNKKSDPITGFLKSSQEGPVMAHSGGLAGISRKGIFGGEGEWPFLYTDEAKSRRVGKL